MKMKRQGCGFLVEVGRHLPGRSLRMSSMAICMMWWPHTQPHLEWEVFAGHS